MNSAREKYLRKIAVEVLEKYFETESSVSSTQGILTFNTRIIELRVDIARVLSRLPATHRQLLEALHRDGLEQSQSDVVKAVEVLLGQEFIRLELHEILGHFA